MKSEIIDFEKYNSDFFGFLVDSNYKLEADYKQKSMVLTMGLYSDLLFGTIKNDEKIQLIEWFLEMRDDMEVEK